MLCHGIQLDATTRWTQEAKSALITENHDTDGSDDVSENVFSCIHFTWSSTPQTQ
jgi:hypothetical protein